MVIVLASQLDVQASRIVSGWPRTGAVLMTPRDLCLRGWRLESGCAGNSTVVAGGKPLAVGDTTGVVNLLPFLPEYELIDICEGDRSYVAAEASATLLYWLTALRVPVLNRPTQTALSGPGWRPEQWAVNCRRVNIPTMPISRDSKSFAVLGDNLTVGRSITVLGGRCIEGNGLPHADQTIELARLAGVEFLQVDFDDEGERFVSVRTEPQFSNPCHVQAIQQYTESPASW